MSSKSEDRSKKILLSCDEILNQTPPDNITENILALNHLLNLTLPEDDADKLRQKLNQQRDPFPLHVLDDAGTSKPYLKTEFNRHRTAVGPDQYRPPKDVKDDHLEGLANEIFDMYVQLYYGKGTVCSVYFDDERGRESNGSIIHACFAIAKNVQGCAEIEVDGDVWNSVHVVRIQPVHLENLQDSTSNSKISNAVYRIDSSVYVKLFDCDGGVTVSGIKEKVTSKTMAFTVADQTAHIANIGKLIEDIETEIRSHIFTFCIEKTKDNIMTEVRVAGLPDDEDDPSESIRMHAVMLNEAMQARSFTLNINEN